VKTEHSQSRHRGDSENRMKGELEETK